MIEAQAAQWSKLVKIEKITVNENNDERF